jgi:mersacidin/lichenicidin family type 2 lantibiotic
MKIDVIRAWKDEQYRASLTEEQRASLPANPVGMIDVSDAELEDVVGGLKNCSSYEASACCSLDGTCSY